MMKFSIDEILTSTSGCIFYKNPNCSMDKEYFISGITSMIEEPEKTVYMPRYVYINNALEDSFITIETYIKQGIRAFFFDKVRFSEEKYSKILLDLLNRYKEQIDFVIMVSDTLTALRGLAEYVRYRKLSPNVKYAAVTGSVGKTSTTEMLYYVLSQKYKVFRGEPTFNIRYRILHKFLEVDRDVEWFLFECSGQNRGYLKDFSEILIPDIAIVTKITSENIGEYRTLKNLAKEKATLLSAMGKDSVAVLNGVDILREASKDYICKKIYVDDETYQLVNTDKDGSEFIYGGEKYYLPVVGVHQMDNALKVIELAKAIGFNTSEIREGLRNFEPVGDRWVVDKFSNGAEFITDCPNNPSFETMISAIKTYMNIYKNAKYKRIIITRIKALGDFEIQTYLKIARFISKLDIDELICVGSEITIIRDYVKENSNIKVMWFEKPVKLDENDSFIKYLLETLDFEQATLLKGQRKDVTIRYGKIKDILRKKLT